MNLENIVVQCSLFSHNKNKNFEFSEFCEQNNKLIRQLIINRLEPTWVRLL